LIGTNKEDGGERKMGEKEEREREGVKEGDGE